MLTAFTLSARNSALTGGVSSLFSRPRSDLRVTYIGINLWHRVNTILVPVMASRLMLSLKKATVQPKILWSLDAMVSIGRGRSTGDGTINPTPPVPRGFPEISRASTASSEEDMELDVIPPLPPSRNSHHGR